jgi:hypothetical protein
MNWWSYTSAPSICLHAWTGTTLLFVRSCWLAERLLASQEKTVGSNQYGVFILLFFWLRKWLFECCLPVFVVAYVSCMCGLYICTAVLQGWGSSVVLVNRLRAGHFPSQQTCSAVMISSSCLGNDNWNKAAGAWNWSFTFIECRGSERFTSVSSYILMLRRLIKQRVSFTLKSEPYGSKIIIVEDVETQNGTMNRRLKRFSLYFTNLCKCVGHTYYDFTCSVYKFIFLMTTLHLNELSRHSDLGYVLDDRGIEIRFPAGATDTSVPHSQHFSSLLRNKSTYVI